MVPCLGFLNLRGGGAQRRKDVVCASGAGCMGHHYHDAVSLTIRGTLCLMLRKLVFWWQWKALANGVRLH